MLQCVVFQLLCLLFLSNKQMKVVIGYQHCMTVIYQEVQVFGTLVYSIYYVNDNKASAKPIAVKPLGHHDNEVAH